MNSSLAKHSLCFFHSSSIRFIPEEEELIKSIQLRILSAVLLCSRHKVLITSPKFRRMCSLGDVTRLRFS